MNYYDKAKALLDEDAVDFTGAVSAEEIRNKEITTSSTSQEII